jgi:hypothetical protein
MTTVLHVATLPANLPHDLMDALLTATEGALLGLGASRIWVDPHVPGCAIMAEFLAVLDASDLT